MTRRRIAIVSGVAVFLLVSFLLALWLTGDTRERSRVVDLLRSQARGDVPGMLAQIDGCASRPACRAQVAANAQTLRRAGRVRILDYRSATSKAIAADAGLTRVAWDAGLQSLPVVQCVRIERRGLPILGGKIVIVSIGPKIRGDAACSR
ncbi:unannotated protein [freshwater metagenome]|uniref:Unannotated protein n=1 Tax=freshwater metagenome TaxID=449393 RepID=A0A6J7E1S7_9ZZZZ|nr:hypothetical protein [Actinomycetota bacterium]